MITIPDYEISNDLEKQFLIRLLGVIVEINNIKFTIPDETGNSESALFEYDYNVVYGKIDNESYFKQCLNYIVSDEYLEYLNNG